MPAETVFELNYAWWLRWLMVITGLGARRVHITLTSTDLSVQTVYFTTRIPISAIASVEPGAAPWLALAGVHTEGGGTWVVNGGPGSVTAVTIDPPAEGAMLRSRVAVRRLLLGLAEPAEFRAALEDRRKAAEDEPG